MEGSKSEPQFALKNYIVRKRFLLDMKEVQAKNAIQHLRHKACQTGYNIYRLILTAYFLIDDKIQLRIASFPCDSLS